MIKRHEESVPLEKFCPNCGAPISADRDKCLYCGTFLPGIANKLRMEKSEVESRQLKRDIVNGVLSFMEDTRDRKAVEKKEQEKFGRIFAVVFLCLSVLFYVYMLSK